MTTLVDCLWVLHEHIADEERHGRSNSGATRELEALLDEIETMVFRRMSVTDGD